MPIYFVSRELLQTSGSGRRSVDDAGDSSATFIPCAERQAAHDVLAFPRRGAPMRDAPTDSSARSGIVQWQDRSL